MKTTINNRNTNTQNIDVIATKIDYIETAVRNIENKLEADYVTQDEFEPIKRIVYGMISVILVAVIGAIVAIVVKTP